MAYINTIHQWTSALVELLGCNLKAPRRLKSSLQMTRGWPPRSLKISSHKSMVNSTAWHIQFASPCFVYLYVDDSYLFVGGNPKSTQRPQSPFSSSSVDSGLVFKWLVSTSHSNCVLMLRHSLMRTSSTECVFISEKRTTYECWPGYSINIEHVHWWLL